MHTTLRTLALVLFSAAGAFTQVAPLDPAVEPDQAAASALRTNAKAGRDRKPAAQFDGNRHMPIVRSAPEGLLELPEARKAVEGEEQVVAIDQDTQDDFDAAELKLASKLRTLAVYPAAMESPRPGSTLSPTTVFTWSSAPGAAEYYLWVGSCRDCTDIYDSSTGLRRNAAVNIPTDGRIIYVSLFTWVSGDWHWFDYTYTAPGAPVQPARISYPASGATVDRLTEFDWNHVTGATAYVLRAGTCRECGNIFDANVGLRTSQSLTLPRGSVVYLTLFTYAGGRWVSSASSYFVDDGLLRTTRITVTNKLLYTVNLRINGRLVGSVPASSTRYVDQTVARFQLGWELVRPTLSGRPLGDTMTGRFGTVDSPGPAYSFTVDNVIGSGDDAAWYFAPRITNNTGTGRLMSVNHDYESENRCHCVAGAYRENVQMGYYKLFTNSNVRGYRDGSDYTGSYVFWGTEPSGREATSGPLHRMAEEGSGLTRLTVTP